MPRAFVPFDSWRKCLIASVTIRAHEPRPNFPRRTDCCLALDPSNRHLPQAQVTSDVRKTRSMAGGSVHFGDVTACGHCSLAGADRLGDRSRLDGLVLGVPSNLVEVDRSRHDCNCLRVTAVDLTLPREELDGYGGYTSTAHLGHTLHLSLGPSYVLRLYRVARICVIADCGVLVTSCVQCSDVMTSNSMSLVLVVSCRMFVDEDGATATTAISPSV